MSVQVVYDQVTVYLTVSSPNHRTIPLFDLLLPVKDRHERKKSILEILLWIKDLRRWFGSPGLILPQLSAYFENLSWPAFRNIRFRQFHEMEDEELTAKECSTYNISIGTEQFVLERDWCDEQFSTHVALLLMM